MGGKILARLQREQAAVVLSVLTLLLFLERIALDFRYVALEMEGVNDIMPFTAPYMAVVFVVFGSWIWGLLAAARGKQGAFLTLLLFNLLGLLFAGSTLLFLCPTPCQTGAPLADILDWSLSVLSIAASVSAVLAFQSLKQTLAVEQG